MKRFYLGQCDYKWSHARGPVENLWVMEELGEELYRLCNTDGFKLVYQRTNSQVLPGDIYLRNNIYVDVSEDQSTMFVLKYPEAKLIESVKWQFG